jgi:arylamine N-acetyltransferase
LNLSRALDVQSFLDRLGIAHTESPSAAELRRLHCAFVERVPYETIEIQLERATTLDRIDSAERIVRRKRGGYCFHMNGAFSVLLEALGYRVTLHRAGVQNRIDPRPAITRNHLALTVAGLPDAPGTTWLVDVGLGDALHEPLPLIPGVHRQGPFTYGLRPSEIAPGGWRFEHDARGSFLGMDFDPAPATMSDFDERHAWLSHSPQSGFVHLCAVQRRDARGVDLMRAITLSRLDDGEGSRTVIDAAARWYEALADIFGLTLDDVGPADRDRLWRRVALQHEKFVKAKGG